MVHNDGGNVKDTVRMSVTMSADTHRALKKLADEYHVSIAFVVRVAIEKRLSDYLGTLRYIDREQGEKIYNVTAEIADNSRNILNNVRRIGINYNQELKLKNVEEKYRAVLKEKNVGYDKMTKAKDEYDKAKADIENNSLNKEELNILLHGFESAADTMKGLVWHIHG